MRNVLNYFFVFMCSLNHYSQSSCNAPSGKPGNCKIVADCPDMNALISKSVRTKQEVDLLRSAHCGFHGRTPKVCCEERAVRGFCYTPHGQVGTCTSVFQCPNIANLLKQPISQDLRTYIQSARCQGEDRYSVCCSENGSVEIEGTFWKCNTYVAPPDPRTTCCGIDSSAYTKIYRNIDEESTAIDEYPWLILIEYKKNNRIKLLCGGSLISGKYVLTAGHCVSEPILKEGTPTNVRLGEYDTSNEGPDCVNVDGGGVDCTDGTIVVPIEQITVHPEYQPWKIGSRHDIALLRLKTMVSYSDFVRPICLPTMDYTSNPPINFNLYAAGWGNFNDAKATNKKFDVTLPYSSLQSCQRDYSVSNHNVSLWEGQLCAGGVKSKDTCKGDSGGPLMYKGILSIEIIGVVSFGPTLCGTEGIPAVYTKVFDYLPWIRSNILP